ncbi:hypothetical protein D9M70_616130 [compost metagenome]
MRSPGVTRKISERAWRTTDIGNGTITRQTSASTAGSMYGDTHSSDVPCTAYPKQKAINSAAVMLADITQPLTSMRTKSEPSLRLARASTMAMVTQAITVSTA